MPGEVSSEGPIADPVKALHMAYAEDSAQEGRAEFEKLALEKAVTAAAHIVESDQMGPHNGPPSSYEGSYQAAQDRLAAGAQNDARYFRDQAKRYKEEAAASSSRVATLYDAGDHATVNRWTDQNKRVNELSRLDRLENEAIKEARRKKLQ